jgi:hypothetical protein
MTLPTKTNLETMDYSYGGVPFVSVATKAGIDLDTLDYSYAGVPFWGAEEGGTPPEPPTGAVKIMPSLSAVALGNAVRISAVRKVGLSG